MYPVWFAHWGQLVLKDLFPHFEVAITGEKALAFRKEIGQVYNPNRLFAGAVSDSKLPILDQRFANQSMIYICQQNTCQLPVSEVDAALEQMKA